MATKNFYGGSGGGDLLNASSGHDALSGGQGNDTMTDAITDFSVVDILDFPPLILLMVPTMSALPSSRPAPWYRPCLAE